MENQQLEVLLVEDNSEDAELSIRALRKGNVSQLKHVVDGAEALDYLFCSGIYTRRNADYKPRVVVLDINMPKIGGLEVLKQIKADERTKGIPVVILSSSQEASDVATCYEIGANSYIVKPLEFKTYMTTISDLGNYWVFRNHPS